MQLESHITSNIVLVTGHYGCGKTNLCINLALMLGQTHGQVSVIDLDIVNPYFRISDQTQLLRDAGIEVIAPNFAGTVLDTPSLSPAIYGAIERAQQGQTLAIVDVGGDPEGATVLSRFRKAIGTAGYQMLYLVNQRRLLTATVDEALEVLGHIQVNAGLKATHIVGNTHLKGETTARSVIDSLPFVQGVAMRAQLPVAFITAPASVYGNVAQMLRDIRPAAPDVLEVGVYVKTPWE